jgi:hypothetical protein
MGVTPRQVIEHDGFVTAGRQRLADMGADITGAADNENLHEPPGHYHSLRHQHAM